MNISEHISQSLKQIFWVKNSLMWIADPEPDPESGIKIPDPQPLGFIWPSQATKTFRRKFSQYSFKGRFIRPNLLFITETNAAPTSVLADLQFVGSLKLFPWHWALISKNVYTNREWRKT